MSLYQRHRPQSFDQLVGQDAIVSNLKAALADGRVAHAYIFSGPRGTGKTTTARLLADALGAKGADVIEVDAASTRGIDDVREIRAGAILAPFGAAKVYILDEAHQLTPAAWDALLKTLEEPPPHCHFVLATTNPDKIPTTVRSRCHTFAFRPATMAELGSVLLRVAGEEGLEVENGLLSAIATQACGSYRDALTILDQLAAGGDLSVEALKGLMGAAANGDAYQLLGHVAQGEVPEVLDLVAKLHADGTDLGRLVNTLLDVVRLLLTAAYTKKGHKGDQLLADELGTERIFELADRLTRAAEVAGRGGNVRLTLEAALVRAAV